MCKHMNEKYSSSALNYSEHLQIRNFMSFKLSLLSYLDSLLPVHCILQPPLLAPLELDQ